MADEPVATQIRFFDLQSRIGRLRYLAYGIGMSLIIIVPAIVGSMLLTLSPILGIVILCLIYIAAIVYGIALGVRRLHDLDKSGWWLLLSLVPLVNLGLAIYMLFFSGTIGENRFGPQPPPNSGWVIAGAVTYIAVIPIGILAAIAIPAYGDYTVRAQTTEGMMLASGAETAVAEYFQDKNAWPTSLADIYPAAKEHPAGHFVDSLTASVAPDNSAYGIVATMKTEGVSSRIAGATLEVWSNDGGASWHCGPGGANPVEPRFLSPRCRDTDPPPP
ncbi:MAG: DUF805 domain-containing protein [Bacillota bacterium]